METGNKSPSIHVGKLLILINKFHLHILLYPLLFMGLAACGGSQSDSIHNPVELEKKQEVEAGFTPYQIGPTWDAKIVTSSYLRQRNDYLTSKIALSTLKISTPWASGTGFFLGLVNNQFLVATSAHVLKNIPSCMALPVHGIFSLQNKSFRCRNIIGIWHDIDLAIFTIKENRGEDFLGKINPLQFDFEDPYNHGTALTSIGYGSFNNPDGHPTLKESRDCMIYSPSGQFARVKRTDSEANKVVAQEITAFATGCDISPGDSGSAIVNTQSQRVIGVMWATSSPKPVKVMTDDYLDRLIQGQEDSNDVWKYMSYGVSARTIKQRLLDWTNEVNRGGFGLQRRIETILKLIEVY